MEALGDLARRLGEVPLTREEEGRVLNLMDLHLWRYLQEEALLEERRRTSFKTLDYGGERRRRGGLRGSLLRGEERRLLALQASLHGLLLPTFSFAAAQEVFQAARPPEGLPPREEAYRLGLAYARMAKVLTTLQKASA